MKIHNQNTYLTVLRDPVTNAVEFGLFTTIIRPPKNKNILLQVALSKHNAQRLSCLLRERFQYCTDDLLQILADVEIVGRTINVYEQEAEARLSNY